MYTLPLHSVTPVFPPSSLPPSLAPARLGLSRTQPGGLSSVLQVGQSSSRGLWEATGRPAQSLASVGPDSGQNQPGGATTRVWGLGEGGMIGFRGVPAVPMEAEPLKHLEALTGTLGHLS